MNQPATILSYENLLQGSFHKTAKTVLVGGCFDIIHIGHITFLEEAKKQGDHLVVLLESDEFIETTKKRKPFHSQQQRAHMLSRFIMVDTIIMLPLLKEHADYGKIVELIGPSVIAVTQGDTHQEHKERHAQAHNAEVKIVTALLPFSSTNIIYASLPRD